MIARKALVKRVRPFDAIYGTLTHGILSLILMKVIAMRYLVFLLAVLGASCTSTLPSLKPYHLDVQQGNVVTSKMMLQLKPGMTKSQVRYVMGTPLLHDSFHQDRWDYLYQMNKGGNVIERRRVILQFKSDGLASVRGDIIAAGAPGAENAPMASIEDIKTAKSDKTLMAEDEKSSWTERFKFWADDNKKPTTESVVEVQKPSAESEKGWFDSIKFWEDKEKPAASAATPKTVEVAKVEAPKVVVVAPLSAPALEASAMPQVAQQLTTTESTSPSVSAEAINEVANVEPQQKATDEAPVADEKAEVIAMVNAWADAWRTKNMNAYLKFYSEKFAPEGLSRKAWAAERKQRIAGQSGSIGLTLEGVKIDLKGKAAQVEFVQHYSSNKLNEHVTKMLSLSNEQNQWRILKEAVVKPSKPLVANDAPPVETFKSRDVTADEKSEAMLAKMIQESAKKLLEPIKPAPAPKEVKAPLKEVVPIKVEPAKTEVKAEAIKPEVNKDKPLLPEDAPGYFERMLEKIGF
jgi:outer membrane protein assembly factor BamE (lipoprotein component of BamABCDE complex)/ketosteroid isomerase-like protein